MVSSHVLIFAVIGHNTVNILELFQVFKVVNINGLTVRKSINLNL